MAQELQRSGSRLSESRRLTGSPVMMEAVPGTDGGEGIAILGNHRR